jgi:(1->4)-alpha-D-glucan 1-alpha-D-glucosylmutase
LLGEALEEIRQRRALPQSTYRLQFHAGFTFCDAAAIVPYLAALGITDCCASPYLKATPGSTYAYDLLENGQASPHAESFDIDWSAPTRPENRGCVLLPLLGDLYGEVLENGELRLARDGGSFHVQYHEHRFPFDPRSYQAILERALAQPSQERIKR